VTSLAQLKILVNGLRSGGPQRGGTQREQRREIVGYFERFFADLDRLRDLKRYFHERIYACLYEHYYRPDGDEAVSPPSTIDPDNGSGSGRPLATVLDQSDNDAPSRLNGRPMSEIVQQLWTLDREWDQVLSEEDTDMVEIFLAIIHCRRDRPDGSLMIQDNRDMVEIDDEPRTDEEERFAKIISIVPNWVEFGFKALQLAKIWWTTANRIYGRRSPSPNDETRARNQRETLHSSDIEEDEENDEVASLKEEVLTLNDCANQISVEMDSLREELNQAKKHSERVEELYKKLKEAKNESGNTCTSNKCKK